MRLLAHWDAEASRSFCTRVALESSMPTSIGIEVEGVRKKYMCDERLWPFVKLASCKFIS